MTIADNIERLQERVVQSCQKVARKSNEVEILLATKTIDPLRIIEASQAGLILSGENKIQELVSKYEDLKNYPLKRHFIGHLQTNKAKEAVKYADCIQSIDSVNVLAKVNAQAIAQNKIQDVLIQVNTSLEASKSGLNPQEFFTFMEQFHVENLYSAIRVKGLMTLGLLSDRELDVRKGFALLKSLHEQAMTRNLLSKEASVISMGMSSDFEWAIQEGATMIRVGSSVFGARS